MPHVFFFSYAHADKDQELEAFFEDLCVEVRAHTKGLSAKDPRLCFRDGASIPLMTEWRDELSEALQTSTVFVCLASSSLFASRFCGQEFHVFDQRRRQGRAAPAPVILPIQWAPSYGAAGARRIMDPLQWTQGKFGLDYETRGLRYLRRVRRAKYRQCVTELGEAIGRAHRAYDGKIPRLAVTGSFDDIPNAFADVVSEEAMGPSGWVGGPGVANFVLAAASGSDLPEHAARYGAGSTEWRPFLPPDGAKASDLLKAIANREGLLFRQIPVDEHLEQELEAARGRKNLSIVVVDPDSLKVAPNDKVTVFDRDPWDGTAVIVPWNEQCGPWTESARTTVEVAFPVRSKAHDRPYVGPLTTAGEMAKAVEVTLTKLRQAVTAAAASKKERTDAPPAGISASPTSAGDG